MTKWEFEDPRGALNVLQELFPDASRRGMYLIEALRRIDHDARHIVQHSKRYSEERMCSRMRDLRGDLRGVLGEKDYENNRVSINPRLCSGTISIPSCFVEECDKHLFSIYVGDDEEERVLLV
jgi:hypothetical protein